MAELLLELLSEEIPARMQARAEEDLKRLFTKALEDEELEWDDMAAYSTPRRLALHVTGLPTSTPDVSEERRGPSIDAPDKAIEGFLKSAGVTRDQCEEREEKKGTFLYAKIEKKGRETSEILIEFIPEIVKNFPWPKSQRWGGGFLSWVRPLRSILGIFDEKWIDIQVKWKRVSIELEDDGIEPRFSPVVAEISISSLHNTSGHSFLASDYFPVTDFADYKAKLKDAYVVLDREERKEIIREGCEALAKKAKLNWVADEGLLDEVTGLVEWPVPLMGSFDKAYLDLPPEVLVSEMRHHQKYFALRDKKGNLAAKFITVANIETDDKGAAIIAGNERVLAARFADAGFFWSNDRQENLESYLERLNRIVFHAKLGTVGERALRLANLADQLAQFIDGCDAGEARRAGVLAKADLVTGMVGEFPDLQGVMGSYYAAADGETDAVAAAIRDHYAPRGPGDDCPSAPVSVAVALADKLDILVGFFGIEEKPTGSKDPFALRRAALGVIRLITENGLRMPLRTAVMMAENGYLEQAIQRGEGRPFTRQGDQLWDDLIAFIADRLKVQTREAGVRHDLIDAAFAAVADEEDLVRLLARVSALQDFLGTDDGADLLAGTKRAANILRIEEKKDNTLYGGELDATLLLLEPEKQLFKRLLTARKDIDAAVVLEDFTGAMAAIAALKNPIDAFFEDVTVNTDDPDIRRNRLKLLSQIRASLDAVADFSRIEG